MAKSQYTDSITGDVILDTRVINDKYIDLCRNKYTLIYENPTTNFNNFSSVSDGKFGNKCLYINHTSKSTASQSNIEGLTNLSTYKTINIDYSTAVTMSYWIKYLTTLPSTNGKSNQILQTGCLFLNSFSSYSLIDDSYNRSFMLYLGTISNSFASFYYNDKGNYNRTDASTSLIPNLNEWYHFAVVYKNGISKSYINGNLFCTLTDQNVFNSTVLSYVSLRANFGVPSTTFKYLIDDPVIILNQELWTSNFTPPNYYLTGDHNTSKISRKNIVYPYPTDRNDYFDKAFLY